MTKVKKTRLLKKKTIFLRHSRIMDCLQHTSPRKYASKKDVERQKRQEKAALLQKKRRSLELKQERLTQKGAREAAEGDTYHISQVLLYQTQYFFTS